MSLFAPKLRMLRMEREVDSMVTRLVLKLVATTLILMLSVKGEIHAPCRASIVKRLSLRSILQNCVL